MAILSGIEVRLQVAAGNITIDPFTPGNVNPVSVDLTLGPQVRVYETVVHADFGHQEPEMGRHPTVPGERVTLFNSPEARSASSYHYLDSKKANPTVAYEMGEQGLILKPGVLYLMHTAERVHTDHFVPVLDGKSSLGRIGIQAHITAGFGDPGYNGQYTLEVICVHPVRVYPGMRFCQMRFHQIEGSVELYEATGHYTGEGAKGAVASRVHESAFK